MTVSITGRKFNLKDSFKDYAEKKVEKLNKFFGENTDIKVTVTVEKDRHTVEVTVKNRGMIYRSECTASQMEDALDKTVDDLIRKIRKNKTKVEKKLRSESINDFIIDAKGEEEDVEIKVVKTKHFPIKPMDAEEAILEMNLIGHQFFVFRDIESEEICVVYKRKDGNYGLIIPENA